MTLDRKCGSAQQAMDFAAQGVIAGAYDVVIAGGVEMMSLVPMRINRMGKDNEGSRFHARYPQGLVHQGISAELIAARWDLARERLDLSRSPRTSAPPPIARASCVIWSRSGHQRRRRDAAGRAGRGRARGFDPGKLMSLKPAFENAEMSARFPTSAGRSPPATRAR